VVWIAAAASAAPPQYQIFDIGVIQAGDTASQGFGSSPGGVAVGRSVRSNASQAFRWTVGGGLVGLPNLAGRNHAVSNDANDNGIVVGTAAASLFGTSRLPVIWNNGVVSQLPLPAGETLGDANGVNASGIAVGSVDAGSLQQAVIYNGANATVITQTTSSGCFFLTAFGINDSGRIVGQGIDPNNAARNVGIVYDMGNPSAFEVGALPGANGALAFAVGNGGHVVGSSMMNQGSGMPFIWSSATGMVAIPLAAGTSQGSARGVNSAGWVVGQDSSAFSIPFLWDGTTTYRLADLLPAGSGWDLDMNTSSSALGISDSGVIVGTGVHNGETHAYAMVPVQGTPTPSPTPTPTPGPATHFAVVAPGFVISGTPFNFTVTAQDSANNTATGYTGTVHFTSNDTSATLPANSTLTNGTGTFQATLNQPGSRTITATDTVNASITGTSNPIPIVFGDPTPSPSPTPTPTPTPPPDTTDYAIAMTDAPDPVQVGQDLTYTMSITKTGLFFGVDVTVTDTLPAGVTYVSATPSLGSCTGTSTVTCNLGVVPDTATITLVVKPTAPGPLSNTTHVASTGDPNPTNDSATAVTTVIPAATPTPTPAATPCLGVVYQENFDGVVAPDLPANWAASFTAGAADCTAAGTCAQGTNWMTTNAGSDTAPNCAFHNAPGCVTDSNLDSRPFAIPNVGGGNQLYFRHNYNLESGRDGGVLEISIAGGAFTDIITAGGSFGLGGYNGTISTGFLSPIGGRPAWTGNSNGYITTSINLPPAASGQNVVFRFRLATDCSGAGTGWRVDTITGTLPIPCPTPTPPPTATPTPSPTATSPPTPTPAPDVDISVSISDSPDPVTVGQNLTYTIGISNFGPGGATVTMTDGLPAGVNFVSVTPSQGSCTGTKQVTCYLGEVPPSGNATVTLVVTPTQAGPLGNTASAQPNAHDPYQFNNQATASTTVAPTGTPTPTPTSTPTQALNLATRMRVQAGDNVGIGGFIISGNAPKTVAVRGVGPSLAAFGISDFLADPTLELRNSSGLLLKPNDNWQDDPADAAQLTAHGLALQDLKESGIVATLPPGASYTAILAGKNQTAGVGLIEIYDIDQTAGSELANISTRGFVLTGNNVMIGGFILGGDNNTRIVVRGIGPSLAQFGLNPVLTDPTLELHDSNGATLISNNDWQDDSASAAQLISFGLAPQNLKESAIATSLPPGAFTGILAGNNGGTGIGLIEIYNVH
jgi:uncharacterized repeat protein (TIGR01451 family)